MAAKRSMDWRQARVTALVVVGILLLVFGVYQVGKIFDVFADRYEVVTLVSNVAGLREGAPVTVAGQRVGQVAGIEFIPVGRKPPDQNLSIRLAISEEVSAQIRRDSRVFIRPQGLLGDKYVDISPGSSGAPALQAGDTLVSEPSMDIEQFLARGAAILDSASAAVVDMRGITAGLARGEGTLGRLLQDDQLYTQLMLAAQTTSRTLAQLNDPRGSFGRLMHDPALYNRLVAAVTRVDSIGAMVLGGRGTLGRLVASDSLYQSLFGGVSRADSAITGFSSVIQQMTTGGGTLQRLANDPKLYDELLKAVVDLQILLADVRANPRKFVPPVNVRVF